MADIFSSIMDPIMEGLNFIFDPLIAMDPTPENPIFTVFLIATLVSLITTIANKFLVDQEEMQSIQQEMKDFQNELREAQTSGDSKKVAKLQAKQSEFMEKQSKMMTNSFKPAIVTMVPILLVFWWMRASAISGVIVHLPLTVYYATLTPIFHTIGPLLYGGQATIPFAIGWLLWYFICTFGMSQILRKFLGFKQGF
ncbi:EMC3/TMCO1 family protein [Methanobrevibacter sp. OttesenSCG-928-K11]|nr:EMC3/TMCO1 family protein [Methanobrevibacter sp. OttesenSCG-928-K11]MDL2270314.1 EMC3/TMCO1 family protein [Methanobrevibacter sp. OttesenSCG-928-I08]